MTFETTVPVLQVADVSRSIHWYLRVFRFRPDPFTSEPPYVFAILLQLARDKVAEADTPPKPGWAAYIRLKSGELLAFIKEARKYTSILRGPQRMPYGMVEIEVADPDGYRIVVGENLDDSVVVPSAVG